MFASSAESPGAQGLDPIHENVRELPTDVKSPHIGWSQRRRLRNSILLRDIPGDSLFLFRALLCGSRKRTAHRGGVRPRIPFAAVVEQENLMAVQFHPEKSGEAGARVLRNFLEWAQ